MVRTTEGAVRGIRRERDLAFLGIPYAAAPTGAHRFQSPQPVTPWSGIRDATVYGATPQRREEANAIIPERSVPGDDTLNLNVFTPAPGGALPVLVWIHGGGYSSGSTVCDWYDGTTFTRDDIVMVSISYRLGFDGFGVVDGAPDNRGVSDWIAALEWVQRNIAAFGGDPRRVTIAGHSAGGGAVLTLLGMPEAQHLFRAGISFSGALGDLPRELAARRSIRLAEMLGVEPTLDGFRSVSEGALTRQQYRASLLGRTGLREATAALEDGLPWGPVIDGDLLTRPATAAFVAGIGGDKPLLLGAADDEFTMSLDSAPRVLRWVPARLALRALERSGPVRRRWLRANRGRRGTVAVLGRYVADRVFRAPVMRIAEARRDADTWVYGFAWRSPVNGWAHHCLDVPFWFDRLGAEAVAPIAGEDPPQPLADDMHAVAVAFIAGSDPGWPAWRSDPGITRVFGEVPPLSRTAYDGTLPLA